MSIFSSLAGAFGGLYGADDTAVKKKAAELQSAIDSGAVQQAASFGKPAVALNQGLSASAAQNVAYDPSKIDADSAALAPVMQHYLSQFQNGGLAGQAAVNAAQQARGLNAQGGIAGIRQDTLNSGASQAQVANIAQNEISQAGDAVNSLDAQKAAIALKKAVMAAQVSHANLVNHLSAQQTKFKLANAQQQLFNEATENVNDARNRAQSIDIGFQGTQNDIGSQILEGLVSAGSGLFGTGIKAMGAASKTAVPTGASTATPISSTPNIVDGSETSAGYIAPSPTLGRTVVPSQPIFSTPPSLPVTANYFTRST